MQTFDSDCTACAGESVQKYIRQPASFNTQIVALGVDTYLKMLLEDNFVHTDLHPGNILVRTRGVSCTHLMLAPATVLSAAVRQGQVEWESTRDVNSLQHIMRGTIPAGEAFMKGSHALHFQR